jgi:large subunit ribosomal protein L15
MAGLSLQNLKPGPRRRSKRLGRGNASGRGTYSGRGMKGQHARSGAKHIEARALKSFFTRIPKRGGFKSLKPKAATVTLQQINKHFAAGTTVTPQRLRQAQLIRTGLTVKIVATGNITQPLNIKNCAVSAGARTKIEAAGGKIV